jgi:shikimate kinase/GNAT superfamily N-acetyltransferase
MPDAHVPKPTIALIGLRGCGKSMVGRQLAELRGGECVDTDEVVVRLAGKSVAAIFADEGEAGFRRRERKVIAQVVAAPPTVVSVGGGAVLDERNVEALRRVATLVWLTAPVEVLWQRVSADRNTATSRPSLTDRPGLKELEHLLAVRSAAYQRAADLVMDTAGRTPSQVAEEVNKRLTNLAGTENDPVPFFELRHDLRPGDLERIVRFHGTIYAAEYGFDSTFEAYVAGPLTEFVRTRTDRDRLWIAQCRERIVGCIAIVGASRSEAQLRWFLVDPSARGHGLGRRLLHEAVEFCKSRNYESIFLWTVSVLTTAARVYQSFGFKKVEERAGRLWGVDVVEERYVLHLDLGDAGAC